MIKSCDLLGAGLEPVTAKFLGRSDVTSIAIFLFKFLYFIAVKIFHKNNKFNMQQIDSKKAVI